MIDFFKEYEAKAIQLDQQDPLKDFRERFALPKSPDIIYFCNNSLGLPVQTTFDKMQEQLTRWSELGVEGWFEGKSNWYNSFDAALKKPLSHLLGAEYDEVAIMNSLTVNLHLLLTSFYQPTETRFKILIESPSFPSDLYAIKSHLQIHQLKAEDALIVLEPRHGEYHIRHEDLEKILLDEGNAIALVFFNAVNFLTGQVLEMKKICDLAKKKGCLVGFDLAHAAGNIPLKLHDWGVDFAVGCSYKYLCSGPGGPGIAYVHNRHHDKSLPRLSGWWGNDPKTRFQMQLQEDFIPHGGASSWKVSTPSILAMVPLVASLEVFEEASMDRIRKKSELQTAFLLELLELFSEGIFEVITPKWPTLRGSQLSLLIHDKAKKRLEKLEKNGLICDFRPPNIIRVTPSPLYNTFHEIYQFACRFMDIMEMNDE